MARLEKRRQEARESAGRSLDITAYHVRLMARDGIETRASGRRLGYRERIQPIKFAMEKAKIVPGRRVYLEKKGLEYAVKIGKSKNMFGDLRYSLISKSRDLHGFYSLEQLFKMLSRRRYRVITGKAGIRILEKTK